LPYSSSGRSLRTRTGTGATCGLSRQAHGSWRGSWSAGAAAGPVPTWREATDCARQFSNRYLSPGTHLERQRASAIPVALLKAASEPLGQLPCWGPEFANGCWQVRDGSEDHTPRDLQVWALRRLVGAQPSSHHSIPGCCARARVGRGLALLAVLEPLGLSPRQDSVTTFSESGAPLLPSNGPRGCRKSTGLPSVAAGASAPGSPSTRQSSRDVDDLHTGASRAQLRRSAGLPASLRVSSRQTLEVGRIGRAPWSGR